MLMAIAIMISTFGCINSLVLPGARAYYAMARDRLFFREGWEAESQPGAGVVAVDPGGLGRRCWCCRAPTIPRPAHYGNLYGNLLDYVISAALIFYILTIAAVFRLRHKMPHVERSYRVPGYPVTPALYILGAAVVLVILFAYRPATTWPGLVIVLAGAVVYAAVRRRASQPLAEPVHCRRFRPDTSGSDPGSIGSLPGWRTRHCW